MKAESLELSVESRIRSGGIVGAHVEGSRVVLDREVLPDRAIGLGKFSVGETAAGLPQLVDAGGQGWGVFANEQLARATAERLSR